MALVDNEYRRYTCPHCKGYLELNIGWYHEGGSYFYLSHISESGDKAELEEQGEAE